MSPSVMKEVMSIKLSKFHSLCRDKINMSQMKCPGCTRKGILGQSFEYEFGIEPAGKFGTKHLSSGKIPLVREKSW